MTFSVPYITLLVRFGNPLSGGPKLPDGHKLPGWSHSIVVLLFFLQAEVKQCLKLVFI